MVADQYFQLAAFGHQPIPFLPRGCLGHLAGGQPQFVEKQGEPAGSITCPSCCAVRLVGIDQCASQASGVTKHNNDRQLCWTRRKSVPAPRQ